MNYCQNMKKNKQISRQNTFTEFLLYTTPNGKVKVEIFLRDETVWLSQDKIALLFNVQRPAITKHLKNIFESGELDENSVSSILEHTAGDGKTYLPFPVKPRRKLFTTEPGVKNRIWV